MLIAYPSEYDFVMARRISGILFDLGDTILDFGRIDIRTLFEQGARLSYDYLGELGQAVPSFAKYHRKQNWAVRWSYLKSRFTRREFNALDTLGRLSLKMGHDLTPQQLMHMAWLWYQPLASCAVIEPDTKGLLERLRQRGLKIGVVSNTFVPGQVLDEHLSREGLLELLPVRVYSCDVRYRKPHRSIFKLALDRLRLDATETLFVGDSLEADIRGANRAGMISVLKDPHDRHLQPSIKPAHRIHRLAELPDVLAHYET